MVCTLWYRLRKQLNNQYNVHVCIIVYELKAEENRLCDIEAPNERSNGFFSMNVICLVWLYLNASLAQRYLLSANQGNV